MQAAKNQPVAIPLHGGGHVSGVLAIPEVAPYRDPALILAHGAGNDMNNPLLVALAQGLGQRGYCTLRFNFPYKERGKKSPDSQSTLVAAWQSAYHFLRNHPRWGTERIVAGGKSMGGRVASQMVAEGVLPAERLLFLGYPLHPPGKTDRLRDAHLYHLTVPMLFFAGTRDPLCDLDKLRSVLSRMEGPCRLEVIEGGDHSFHVPKSLGVSQPSVHQEIVDRTGGWLDPSRTK